MTDGSRRRPAWYIGVRYRNAVPEFLGKSAEAAAEHYSGTRPQRRAAFDELARFLVHKKIPAMQADIKLAMVPAITALNPSRARSGRRLGASAPMPPI